MSTAASPLRPRKQPVQDRSRLTVDAIHVATIQVLAREGIARCTTTRVAERAGVSVGTLYQYYAQREAMLAAALERHMKRISGAVEEACATWHGKTLEEMVTGLVHAFLAAKFENAEESRSLYAVAETYGGNQQMEQARLRIRGCLAAMLASARDVRIADIDTAVSFFHIALMAPARARLVGELKEMPETMFEENVVRLLLGYLRALPQD
ncbi:TetR/AcrR family transcriptional regulator [Pseudoruegeria sp. HB172150]|uniref:TetR/AcrR family transcriptional regulator n=1 Tax=Pseudoruegeria sp. HB172150 TaxID=2721164 RepID=UPI0015571D30|nr:TetR/AcrR family transcriptional regulator [Pseudoruegeria sp. HB172150]